MAATPGFHGFEQSLDTNDTYETIFDANTPNIPRRGIRGIEIWCTGANASVLIEPIAAYGAGENPATIVAGQDPTPFYADSIRKVQIKQGTVSGNTVSWRTIVN